MVSICTGDDRGASEVLGVVLLIGIVVTASLLVVVFGAPGIEAVQSQTDEQQAETILQEFDSRLSSLAASSDSPRTQYDLGETNPRQFRVSNDGWLNVTVNRNESCASNVRLSSVHYENDNNVDVAYQAGGVWNRYPGNNSTMVSEPSVQYRDGTIDINVVNLTGNLDQAQNNLVLEGRETPTAQISQGDCVRPNNVTIAVQSPYYQAWARYLESEFGTPATAHDSNQTATLYIPQDELPERVNDDENNVVNLSDGSRATVTSDGITFDKGAGNQYTVTATPLGDGTVDVGNITSVDSATNVTRPPLDVVLVLDDSGSMGTDDDGDGRNRLDDAQRAAQQFVGGLNSSQDRVGVVSYNSGATYELSNQRYFNDDFDTVNDSVEAGNVGGGTNITDAMQMANTQIELQSNTTRDRAIIVLSDGANNYDGNNCEPTSNDDDPYDCYNNIETIRAAQNAGENGVAVYTIGYGEGGNYDGALMRELAAQTDGSFYEASDAEELEAVFEDIQREIVSTQMIARTPVSSNYTTETGQVYSPQAAGDTDQIAQYDINGESFRNINDPTADSQFSHSFAVNDGEAVDFRTHSFECADDGWVGTGRYQRYNNTSYQVIRCSDISRSTDTLEPTNIYLDGDNIETTDGLLTAETAWWQEDINASFAANSEISVCRSRDATSGGNCDGREFGEIDLRSNQALVYFDLDDGTESNNRLLMLYEIGIAEEDADAADVINIEVSTVRTD
jgi:flagellin-like protein